MKVVSATDGIKKEFFSDSTEKTWQINEGWARDERHKEQRGLQGHSLSRSSFGQLNNYDHCHESESDSARCRYSWPKL